MRAVECLLAVLLSIAWGSPLAAPQPAAIAGPQSEELDRARDQLRRGELRGAVDTIHAALRSPDLSESQLVALYELLGLANLYLGDEPAARQAYERLLQVKPDFELQPGTSPRVRALYERIIDDIRQLRLRPVTLRFSPVAELPAGQPATFIAAIEHLPPGAQGKLLYRRSGGQAYSAIDFEPRDGAEGSYQARIPAFELPGEAAPFELEYYVEVTDAARRRLAGSGDPYNPHTARVTGQRTRGAATASAPWYADPWVLGIGGAVIAGTAVGIAIAASSPQTGTLTLDINTNTP